MFAKTDVNQPICRFGLAVLSTLLIAATSHAHMAWLSSDDEGHATFWFGESPADRTYHLPEAIAGVKLHAGPKGRAITTEAIERDDLIGLRSGSDISDAEEVYGTVTYGLYHGMKLTYHVEHLPQHDPAKWPSEPRKDTPLQTMISAAPEGGILVTALHEGKPLVDVEVSIYDSEGEQNASKKSDSAGIVTFASNEVKSGLNAVMVGVKQADLDGELNGKKFSNSADYLTSTFFFGRDKSAAEKKDSESKQQRGPQVDPDSGVSVTPSGLPDLPEELTSFGAAVAGDKLYVYGGHTGNAHSYSTEEQSNRLWSISLGDEKSAKWAKVAEGPRLQGLALIPHGNDVVRIGGFTAMNDLGEDHDLRSQTDVARFNAAGGEWIELSPLPEPRSSFDAVVIDDVVYVIGGWQLLGDSEDSRWHQTAWSLDLSDPKATWKPIAEPPFQRRALSTAAHGGKLYAIGGMRETGGPTTRVDVYDPAADAWSSAEPIPGSGMSGFGTASHSCGSQLIVSGMDGFVHALDDSAEHWQTVAKLDPARFFHRMVPVSDRELLIVGGANMEIGKFVQVDRIRLSP